MTSAWLIYQHATTDRDRSIADALSELVDLGRAAESKDEDDGPSYDREGRWWRMWSG